MLTNRSVTKISSIPQFHPCHPLYHFSPENSLPGQSLLAFQNKSLIIAIETGDPLEVHSSEKLLGISKGFLRN
jgi:hypothetical protein